jgi:NitT/TauT family transport system permease protein
MSESAIGSAAHEQHAAESREVGGSGWRRAARNLAPLWLLLVIVIVWETVKIAFRITDFNLPHLIPLPFGSATAAGEETPSILGAFFEPTATGPLLIGVLARAAAITWLEAVVGFIFGGLLGFLLGVLFSHSRLLERGLLPYVVASQTVPILAIAPMIVVWRGTGWDSKALIAAYLTFFPVTINTLRGLQAVEPTALELMHSYAATRREILLKLRLPAAVPYIFTALKISATASVVGAIIGELPVGSTQGIGPAIINYAQYYNTWPPNLWATILVAALVGIGFYALVAFVERRVVTWLPPTEGG